MFVALLSRQAKPCFFKMPQKPADKVANFSGVGPKAGIAHFGTTCAKEGTCPAQAASTVYICMQKQNLASNMNLQRRRP